MDAILAELNDAQRSAVTHERGPLLVVAGAGSGKTRVITRRVAWILANGCPDEAILGLTFTNKAAGEMAERVTRLVPGSRVRLSTFHSACARFLRRSAERAGFTPDFTIYDVDDRNRCLKELMKERGVSTEDIRPSVLGSRISALKNRGVSPEDFAPRYHDTTEEAIAQCWAPYQRRLREMNAMDFDDLLLHFLALLDADAAVREDYARRFAHVLVDEFQDTNRIQYDILRHLTGPERNLSVVGDPDQSIYRFRGAELGNILRFSEDFEDTTVVKLETNYRSSATILRFAQEVISKNVDRIEKTLVPHLGDGEPIDLFPCDTGRDEATEVALQIRSLLHAGVARGEIAIFYRARYLSRRLEELLRRHDIPYHIVGDVGFFARKEIKDLVAFLQVCVNPRDKVALSRILNVPPRGLGPVSAERFFAEAQTQGLAPGEFLRRKLSVPGLSGRPAKGLAALGALFADAWQLVQESVESTLALFLERSDYLNAVCRTGDVKDVDREENVKELLVHARGFDAEWAGLPSEERDELYGSAVASYLGQVSLLSDTAPGAQGEGVQLMTVHAAKGLEFEHVFLVGLEEGIFPHALCLDDREELEEERRLFYVAATRAKRGLTCTLARFRETFEGGFRPQDPSRFLAEGGLALATEEERAVDSDFAAGAESAREAPQLVPAPETIASAIAAGQLVRHEAFGQGRVLRRFGSGRSAKVEVQFVSGTKILLLEYARLECVESA